MVIFISLEAASLREHQDSEAFQIIKCQAQKNIKNEDENSKLIKAFPKDTAALDKRSVFAKVNSHGSGT